MNKDEMLIFIKSFNNNSYFTLQDWTLLCASHIVLHDETYNSNGSIKSVCEQCGHMDTNMYNKKEGEIH